MTELQELIKATIKKKPTASTGWYPLKCKVCSDYKVRAAFKFSDDGSIAYNCFRGKCTASCGYTPGEYMTGLFRKVLRAYDIVMTPELKAEQAGLRPTRKKILNDTLFTPHYYTPIELPTYFRLYDADRDTKIKEYLASKCLDVTDFYVNGQDWIHFPLRLGSTLFGYQSVCITRKAYLHSAGNTDKVWFPDGIIPDRPIVCESIIDALSVPDGIALLHSDISPKQAYFLHGKSPVLLPDRKGSRFLKTAIKYGWPLIVPDYKEKDANKALQKYGMLVLAENLRDNIYTDVETMKMKFKMWAVD